MKSLYGILFLLLLTACWTIKPTKTLDKTYRIGLGSCAKQTKEQSILTTVVQRAPNVFLYLGDNIYGDTRDMQELQAKYQQLAEKPSFQALKAQVPLLATWDDHDYGENDAGRYYPYKDSSKAIFLDFWEEPASSTRWQHEGVYHALFLENAPLRLQVILLDTRSFRDDLTHRIKGQKTLYKNDYQPTISPDSTFLGDAQWTWLEHQLQQPADLRLIASSNQFAHQYNGWESWNNVPHEQMRFLQLIQKTKANGVVFLSGDVHWGELSCWKNPYTYPIYDLTSSGLTQNWSDTEPNTRRLGKVVRQNNFGLIEVDVTPQDTTLTFQLINKKNQSQLKRSIKLSELHF
ncbi:MAG: alkaline phosphatase D family protein [Aureispira sp.]